MNQNTEIDQLWESIFLDKFPNTPHHKVINAKVHGAIDWCLDEKTILAELYSKFVMMKRLKGIEPGEEN